MLRGPGPRAALIEALGDVDRLVLLGDVLELRHGPRRDALAAARPFFEELGRVLAGREIVVLAGNHDHALVESWSRDRDEAAEPTPLGLEQRFSAEEASSMLATLASWAGPAHLSAAYPGLWLRPDVYATHGHYLDCHLTVPTMERLGIGMTARVQGRSADEFATVETTRRSPRPCSPGSMPWRARLRPGPRSTGNPRCGHGAHCGKRSFG